MEISVIVSLVSASAALISALAAAISCIMAIRNTKPQIKIELINGVNQSGYTTFEYDGKLHTIAFFEVQFINSSAASGTIKDIYLCINKKRYCFEQAGSTYASPAKLSFDGPIDISSYRLQLPLIVSPHSVVRGFFFVPEFPVVTEDFISVKIGFEPVRRKRYFNRKKFRAVLRKANTISS